MVVFKKAVSGRFVLPEIHLSSTELNSNDSKYFTMLNTINTFSHLVFIAILLGK